MERILTVTKELSIHVREVFVPLAAAGEVNSQFQLAELMRVGEGGPKDEAGAARNYRMAADVGHRDDDRSAWSRSAVPIIDIGHIKWKCIPPVPEGAFPFPPPPRTTLSGPSIWE
jgi:hypothetical protein